MDSEQEKNNFYHDQSCFNMFNINLSNSYEKSYLRDKIIFFKDQEEHKEKGILIVKELLEQNFIPNRFYKEKPNMRRFLEELEFYFYNSETIIDYGWGCAWRSFQTLLKTLKNYISLLYQDDKVLKDEFKKLIVTDISFDKLFFAYGSRNHLEQIILKKQRSFEQEKKYDLINIRAEGMVFSDKNIGYIPGYLSEKKFAPFENEEGWAEPFIMHLIAVDLQIFNGKLYLLNGYPQKAYAPEQVFEKTINFELFVEILTENFNRERPLPIIIDDSVLCLCLLGINKTVKGNCKDHKINNIGNEDNDEIIYEVLIGDPHVKLLIEGKSGIYYVTLNSVGQMIGQNFLFNQTLYGSRIDFSQKRYMIYILPTI